MSRLVEGFTVTLWLLYSMWYDVVMNNAYIIQDDGSITLRPDLNLRLWCIAHMVTKALGYSGAHVGVLETVQVHIVARG